MRTWSCPSPAGNSQCPPDPQACPSVRAGPHPLPRLRSLPPASWPPSCSSGPPRHWGWEQIPTSPGCPRDWELPEGRDCIGFISVSLAPNPALGTWKMFDKGWGRTEQGKEVGGGGEEGSEAGGEEGKGGELSVSCLSFPLAFPAQPKASLSSGDSDKARWAKPVKGGRKEEDGEAAEPAAPPRRSLRVICASPAKTLILHSQVRALHLGSQGPCSKKPTPGPPSPPLPAPHNSSPT